MIQISLLQFQETPAATRTLDLASTLEVGSGAASRPNSDSASNAYNQRSVLTIAFQFTYENHLRENVAAMARQYVRSVVASVQRVAMAITPSRLGAHIGTKNPPGSPEALTLARWISRSYRYVFCNIYIMFAYCSTFHQFIIFSLCKLVLNIYVKRLIILFEIIMCLSYYSCTNFFDKIGRFHTGVELLRADTQAGDSLLKLLWHHTDAIMCCSLKASDILSLTLKSQRKASIFAYNVSNNDSQPVQASPVFTFANQAGLDMLETTLVALQDINLEKILDDNGRKVLCSEFSKIMQQVKHQIHGLFIIC